MPVLAVRMLPSPLVLGVRHHFQVVRPNTTRHAAEMIELASFGDTAPDQLECKAMGVKCRSVLWRERSISARLGAGCPHPAGAEIGGILWRRAVLVDPCPEPLH